MRPETPTFTKLTSTDITVPLNATRSAKRQEPYV